MTPSLKTEMWMKVPDLSMYFSFPKRKKNGMANLSPVVTL